MTLKTGASKRSAGNDNEKARIESLSSVMGIYS